MININSCELTAAITAVACSIAKDKSEEELALWGAIFNQLGDCLATIAAQNAFCRQEGTE